MSTKNETLTMDDAKLYDRQIRLWGMEAQQRMRNTNILLVGLNGLANEVSKNLILAGLGSITLLDPGVVAESDVESQFFLREEDLGRSKAEAVCKRLQNLNPSVLVLTETNPTTAYPKSFFLSFEIVCVFSSDYETISLLNGYCHEIGNMFFASDTMGLKGFIFSDLADYVYQSVKDSSRQGISFKSFEHALETKWNSLTLTNLKKFKRRAHPLFFALLSIWNFTKEHKSYPNEKIDPELQRIHKETMERVQCFPGFVTEDYLESVIYEWNSEISSVCAVLGGILSQEILKCIAAKEVPMYNFLCFDGHDSEGQILKLF